MHALPGVPCGKVFLILLKSCRLSISIAHVSLLSPQGRGAFGKVYKALRGGVQDVAVKQLHHTGDGQLEHFIEVLEHSWHKSPGRASIFGVAVQYTAHDPTSQCRAWQRTECPAGGCLL